MRKLILRLEPDIDAECPSDWDGWKLYSFSTRHNSFKHPDGFVRDEYGNIPIGMRTKLEAGTAFWLDYYEHSACRWSLSGEGMQCRWDTARRGGILLWEGNPKDLPRNRREESARSFCETYSNWANGWCYYFELETEDSDHVDSCGGFYTLEDVEGAIKEALEPGDVIVEVTGDCKDMTEHMKLPIEEE